MSVLGLVLLAVLGVLGGRYLWTQRPAAKRKRHMTALLEACHRDQELAERLIMAELESTPDLDFGEAARRARARLIRDRKR